MKQLSEIAINNPNGNQNMLLSTTPHPIKTRALMWLLRILDLESCLRRVQIYGAPEHRPIIKKHLDGVKQHAILAAKEYHEHEKEIKRLEREIKRLKSIDAKGSSNEESNSRGARAETRKTRQVVG